MTFGYDATTGHRIGQRDGRGDSTRVSFRYYADESGRGLLRAIEYPLAGLTQAPRDTMAYDNLGNLRLVQSPMGKRTEIVRDAIGRETLTRTALNETYTQFLDEIRKYDLRDADTLNVTTSSGTPTTDAVIVRKRFDAEGNVDTVATKSDPDINGIGWITRGFAFDAVHRQTSEELIGGNVITTGYDPAGNVAGGGREGAVTYTYDALNRPLTRIGEELATFTYDSAGNIRTANNPYARITRYHFPNGALKIDLIAVSASDTSLRDFTHKYELRYEYDLNGRRTAVIHPSGILATTNGRTDYAYEPLSGALTTVTDAFGNRFVHAWDAASRLRTLTSIADSPERIVETRSYDADGQLFRRLAGGSGMGAGNLRDETITYDMRGKMLSNSFHSAEYTPLGALKRANLGNPEEAFQPDALGNYKTTFGNHTTTFNTYWPQTGLPRFAEKAVSGSADTTTYFQQGNGAAGETIVNSYLSGLPPEVQRLVRTTRNNYTRDNRLASVWVNVDSNPPPPGPQGTLYRPYRFEESYRYDALGRRIEARVWRSTNCEWKDLESGCKNTVTRSIWDGAQLLYELRWVFQKADTVPTAWQFTFGPEVVGYTHGLGIDQPLDLFNDGAVIVPHANWRGVLDQGPCPTAMCGGTVGFPGQNASSYGAIQPDGRGTWYGSLIGGMTDASGYQYKRNRYMDPATGRFTQEDPIGLAGGLNLYGYAAGDPVNYSDPFGLMSCPPMCYGFASLEGALRGIGAGAQAWAAEVAESAKDFWSRHGDKIVETVGVIASARGGGGRIGLRPDPRAAGPHTTFKVGPDGKVSKYETWEPQTNPRNPAPWESVKRFDRDGDPHFNKATQKYVPTPHVHEPKTPGGVRPAEPWEIPRQ